MQAEWYGTLINQIDAGSVFYRGCHADCGYFLTGEHRHYDASSGTQGKVHVRRPFLRGGAERDRPRGYGAWELTARFAYLDFLDADTPLGSNGQSIGVQLAQSTFGMN